MEQLQGIMDYLKELEEDTTVPRNVKAKIKKVLEILKSEETQEIKINKALDEIEEVADDGNLQTYTRTQIWNVVSMLENI